VTAFAVEREAGRGWTAGGIFDQPAVNEHATFMNALADEGFVLFGGPLAGSEDGRVRVLLIVEAKSEVEIRRRLADDPWVRTEQLVTTSIEPWNVIVGARRAALGAIVDRGANAFTPAASRRRTSAPPRSSRRRDRNR
jgi:uncharacterized protein YciI